jgi:hypothetical protein
MHAWLTWAPAQLLGDLPWHYFLLGRSYSSVGMGKDCKVHDMTGLIAQV